MTETILICLNLTNSIHAENKLNYVRPYRAEVAFSKKGFLVLEFYSVGLNKRTRNIMNMDMFRLWKKIAGGTLYPAFSLSKAYLKISGWKV